MKRDYVALILLTMIVVSASASDALGRSSTIDIFHLNDCNATTCISASAPKASVANSHTAFSAINAELTVSFTDARRTLHYQCVSFRYDLATQFLSCDNRDRPTAKISLTIDRKFQISQFRGPA